MGKPGTNVTGARRRAALRLRLRPKQPRGVARAGDCPSAQAEARQPARRRQPRLPPPTPCYLCARDADEQHRARSMKDKFGNDVTGARRRAALRLRARAPSSRGE